MAARPAIDLSDEEICRLALEALCHSDTVRRWAAGRYPVARSTNARLERAMMKFGIERRPKESAKTISPNPRRRVVQSAA